MKLIAIPLSVLLLLSCNPTSSVDQIDHRRLAHDLFLREPNREHAIAFFDSLPSDFAEFNRLYGFPDPAGPLYDLPLHETLPRLQEFIEPTALADKIVLLASASKWDADNVNALQKTYRTMFETHPETIAPRISELAESSRRTALRFLFDGPHPSNKALDEDLRSALQRIDPILLRQADEAFSTLLQNKHSH